VTHAAFYCIADDRYFVGAAALVNSLRLLGHHEPIHMLDCGLADAQREMLEPQVSLLTASSDTPPWLLKAEAPLRRPADVTVLLDTDMVVTRSLAPLIESAFAGRVVAFANPIARHFPGWGELLGLGPSREAPYVSSAAVFIGAPLAAEVLGLLADRQSRVDFDRTFWRANDSGYEFLYADQDVLNAILASRLDPDRVEVLESRLTATPPFAGLRLVDERTLRCGYADGAEPYLVHHHVIRPWLEPTHDGIYSRLLRRLLLADDVPIRLDPAELPLWLRTGPLAWARRQEINARERFRFHIREPLRARSRRAVGGDGEATPE
jgi:hypothetical protein